MFREADLDQEADRDHVQEDDDREAADETIFHDALLLVDLPLDHQRVLQRKSKMAMTRKRARDLDPDLNPNEVLLTNVSTENRPRETNHHFKERSNMIFDENTAFSTLFLSQLLI